MATSRLDPRVALVAGVLAVAGCSAGSTTIEPTPPRPSASTSASAATSGITTAADVGRVMGAGAQSLQSAQITVRGGGTEVDDISGDGVATFSGGRLTALEIDGPAASGAGALRIRVVEGTAYLRTYDLDGNPTGSWQRVTTGDAEVAGARSGVAAIVATADPGPLADAFGTATSFKEVGTVGYGIRYSLDGFGSGAALSATLGADVRPTQAYVDLDPAGRPRQASVRMTVDGEFYAVQLSWSDFDEPVTIEVPPADEIAD